MAALLELAEAVEDDPVAVPVPPAPEALAAVEVEGYADPRALISKG